MPSDERGRIRPVRIEDAQGYAEMMKRSDKNWPWTSGIPYTPRMARDSIEGSAAIGNYVAEVDEKIVGCCTLVRGFRDKDSAYVGFLNVEPDYQGQGFGRRLLRAAVDKGIEQGLSRVDLNTWPGNLKALPLYKKTGFFWVPETNVSMVNFLPQILGHPLFKDFFERNPDWYKVQVRDLAARPDELERDHVRIYRYAFRSDSEEITAIADRQGRWLTGGANKDLDIWIHPEQEVSPEGFAQSIYWDLKNKMDSKISATLLVETPESAQMTSQPPKTLCIPPGQGIRLEGRYRIDPEWKRKGRWEEPERIHTLLMIGEEMMEFRTGIGRQAAVELSYDPSFVFGYPGAETKLRVRMRNTTKLSLKGTVTATSIDERMVISPEAHGFKIDPEGYAGFACDLRIDSEASSSYLPIVFSPSFMLKGGEKVAGKSEYLHASCLSPGDLLDFVEVGGKILNLHNDRLRVSINLREGGSTRIRDRHSEAILVDGPSSDALGPPFWPTEFTQRRCEHKLERGDGFIKATVYMKSEIHQGLTLFREHTLHTGQPILTLRYGLINDHAKARSFLLYSRLGAHLDHATIYLPTKYGLIYEDTMNRYPMGGRDAPERPREYEENWIALQGYEETTHRLFTIGSIWPWKAKELLIGGNTLAFPKIRMRVPPKGRVISPPIHVYAAEGSWEGLRETWRRLERRDLGPEKRILEIERRKPLSFGFTQCLLTPSLGPVDGILEVTNLRAMHESGTVEIQPPDGWRSQPRRISFHNLSWNKKRQRKVVLTPPTRIDPGVYEGRLVLEGEATRKEAFFPVILLGKGTVKTGTIVDHRRKAISVSNGTIEFKVCPSFGGILYSMTRNGVEYLSSAFPKDRPLLWFNPWYGGLSSSVAYPSEEWKETHTAETIREGLWKGVEVRCRPGKFAKRAKGLYVRTRYLTANSSNILRIEQELENNTTAARYVYSGVRLFPGIGEREKMESVILDEQNTPYPLPWRDEPRYHRPKEGWVAVRNTELDASLILAGPVGRRAYIYLQESRGMTEMIGGIGYQIGPGQSSTWSWHVALASSELKEIPRYKHLRELGPTAQPLAISQ